MTATKERKVVVKIEPTEENTFTVNSKEVYRDISGNWICKEKFSEHELKAWSAYKKLVLDENRKASIMKFTY